MRLWTKKPRILTSIPGTLLSWSPLGENQILAATTSALVLCESEENERYQTYSWSDIEYAHWSGATRRLDIGFVAPSSPPLSLTFPQGYRQRIAYVIRERVQNSLVYQEHVELPSGAKARGMVRRGTAGDLFTQILIEGVSLPEDEAILDQLEVSMRDVVGLSNE